MIKRDIARELRESAREYPVVTVLGSRQSGKTTVVRMVFPRKKYVSFEDPDVRAAAQTDARGFLSTLTKGGILDEIQRAPHLLSYIQGMVDRSPGPGRFILTGSHQTALHQEIGQTLAGRTAILTLMPFSFSELSHFRKKWDAFSLIVSGCYPRLHHRKLKSSRFFNGYIQTYLERDVRALVNIKDLNRFQQFMVLLAGRTGQVVNYSSLSNDVGVSSTTIKEWVSILAASYIINILPPFHENIRKRVVKSPKIYFADPGLAAHLVGITQRDQVIRDPIRGGLYENLIICEVLKSRLNKGLRPECYFYRDSHGNEVDLVIRLGRRLVPVEIKSSATYTSEFTRGLQQFKNLMGDICAPGYVLYNGNEEYKIKGIKVYNPIIHQKIPAMAARENV